MISGKRQAEDSLAAASEVTAAKRSEVISKKKKKGRYRCPFCTASFGGLEELRCHKGEVHFPGKPHAHPCHFCTSFKSHSHEALMDHVVSRHAEMVESLAAQKSLGIFVCEICASTFSSTKRLRIHLLTSHPDQGPKKCKECKAGFWTKRSLDEHECPSKKAGNLSKIRIISDAKEDLTGQAMDYYDELFAEDEEEDDELVVTEMENPEAARQIELFPVHRKQKARAVHADHAHFVTGFRSEIRADNFECGECGSQFESSDLLLNHLDQHQAMERTPWSPRDPNRQCIICGFVPKKSLSVSQRARAMSDHVISSHFQAMLPETYVTTPEGEKLPPPPRHAAKKTDANSNLANAEDDEADDVTTISDDDDDDEEDLGSSDVIVAANPMAGVRCKVCMREFESDSFLRIHMKYHHNPDSAAEKQLAELNTCVRCNKSCTSEGQLKLHLALYCDVTFNCDLCFLPFKQIRALAIHVRTVHKFGADGGDAEKSQENDNESGEPMTVVDIADDDDDDEEDENDDNIDEVLLDEESSNDNQVTTNGINQESDDGNSATESDKMKMCHFKDCSKTFRNYHSEEYELHLASHGDFVPKMASGATTSGGKYDLCPFCDVSASSQKRDSNGQRLILAHVKTNHTEEAKFCPKCNWITNNIDVFCQHYKKHLAAAAS